MTVQTPGGQSILYRGRYLYSSRDPARSPCEAVKRAELLPESLVICVSPALGYGLESLLRKLPEKSFVLAIEHDESLRELSASSIPDGVRRDSRFRLATTDAVSRLSDIIGDLPGYPFRRCVRIDLSGGSRLNPDFYDSFFARADSLISTFWKNRMTLMHLGRTYARNLFMNANLLPSSLPIEPGSCDKPILVAGAGPSLERTLDFARDYRDRVFLLAVDTALVALRAASLVPDAVVLVESQFWISRAFIGFSTSKIPVFADMTARTEAVIATGGPVHFFHTPYADSAFLARFASSTLAPLVIPRLGSVGLVALHLARHIAGKGLPVFFTGLDFSWGSGLTHARGTSPAIAAHLGSTRLAPPNGNPAGLADRDMRVSGKDGAVVRTDPVLSLYADLCRQLFSGDPGIFDLGESGLVTGCRRISTLEAGAIVDGMRRSGHQKGSLDGAHPSRPSRAQVRAFIEGEVKMLSKLREIFTGNAEDGKERLPALLEALDYLYLHFPDGHKGWRDEQNFLNRVRVETEYFLKTLTVRAL